MLISWNWLSEWVNLKSIGKPEKLAELLTRLGLEVEAIEFQGKGLENVITAQILERNKHPQADRLSLCKVTWGTKETLDIVCGAQNMKAGDKVALARIGAELPNGMKIVESKIRGVISCGMLCSEEELKLKEKSEGIIILPESTPLGKPLAEILGRHDTLLHLKLTPNRGDCLSHLGIAREVAAFLGQELFMPKNNCLSEWETKVATAKTGVELLLEAGEEAPQFFGCLIEGVRVGPSPDWLVKRLEALGSRSINNLVDVSNLAMLELGHPMHIYDADLIKGNQICVRLAQKGEKLPLLDGTTVSLQGEELVIADRNRAIGLAGVMGGGNSEVREGTKRVFLECAEFSPIRIRRTAVAHQKRTEASLRFEKGIDPSGLPFAITRLMTLVLELSGGSVKGMQWAYLPSRSREAQNKRAPIVVPEGFFERFLGMQVSIELAETVLKNLNCRIERMGSALKVTPPSYRLDLQIAEDLSEEIARSVGYDKIPSNIPALSTTPTPQMADDQYKGYLMVEKAKDVLASLGLHETLNLSFTSKKWLEETGFTPQVKILNPLSEDHEWLVPSLLPHLIRNALSNWSHSFGSEIPALRFFELRPVFSATGPIQAKMEIETGMRESWKLGILLSGPMFNLALKNEQRETDFYDLKALVQCFFEKMGIKGVRFKVPAQSVSFFHPGKVAEILIGNRVAGQIGALHPQFERKFKCKGSLWCAELDWETMRGASLQPMDSRSFKGWSEFPPMERDFSFLVKNTITSEQITQVIQRVGKPLARIIKIFDIYQGLQVPKGMTSVAVRVIFIDETRSLVESEVEAASTRVIEALQKELSAELRS